MLFSIIPGGNLPGLLDAAAKCPAVAGMAGGQFASLLHPCRCFGRKLGDYRGFGAKNALAWFKLDFLQKEIGRLGGWQG